MSSPEIISDRSLSTREQFAQYRREQVMDAAGFLLELASEQPHARWSMADVVFHVAAETGLARALVVNELSNMSDNAVPLDDEGSAFYRGVHQGNSYIQVVRPKEPVQRLDEQAN